MPDAVRLRLAQEEMVYLLRALQIPAIAGASATSLGGLDADHTALAMADADRALRAREIVRADGPDERRVDPVVAGLIRACAAAHYTLLLDHQDASVTRRFVYTFADYAIVEHSQPETHIHQFLAMGTVADALRRLDALLAVSGASPGAVQDVARLTAARWDAARAAMSADPAKAQQILAEELPAPLAAGIASTLREARAVRHLALWHGMLDDAHPRDPQATLTAISGAGGLYVLISAAPGALLAVLPATPELVIQRARTLLEPALAVLRPPQLMNVATEK